MRILKSIILLLCIGVASSAEAVNGFSLLTCGVGSEVYMLEGHTALRAVYDDGRDMTFNWGLFDFADPGFAMKFAKGETDYWVGAEPTSRFLAAYAHAGRTVEEQLLNLSPRQAALLDSLIADNLTVGNRVYRYRYLSDNCATRPLALIERAVALSGESLIFPQADRSSTFRSELRHYHRRHPLYQLFIDIALGADVDTPIDSRQRAFAPLFLKQFVAETEIKDASGKTHPLSAKAETLVDGIDGIDGTEPSPLPWVSLILAGCIATAVWQWRKKRIAKWIYSTYFTLLGLIGIVVAFLMFCSTQEATSSNINILWLNPLCLLPAISVWIKRLSPLTAAWTWMNLGLTALFLLGQPFWTQSPGASVLLLVLSDFILTLSYLTTRKCSSKK